MRGRSVWLRNCFLGEGEVRSSQASQESSGKPRVLHQGQEHVPPRGEDKEGGKGPGWRHETVLTLSPNSWLWAKAPWWEEPWLQGNRGGASGSREDWWGLISLSLSDKRQPAGCWPRPRPLPPPCPSTQDSRAGRGKGGPEPLPVSTRSLPACARQRKCTPPPPPPPSLPCGCPVRARRGLCPLGSLDLPYLFLSFLFLAPECPPQVTEICSATCFHKKLQMTHRRAKSRFIFKPRALGDTVCPSVSSLTRAEAPADAKWCPDPLWCQAQGGPRWSPSWASPQSECPGSRRMVRREPLIPAQHDQHRSFTRFHSTNTLITALRPRSSCWGYSCEQNG